MRTPNKTEFHDEYNLHRDEHMIFSCEPDTKYLGPITNGASSPESNKRVLAKYEEGYWLVESQIRLEGKWWVALRETLRSLPSASETEYTTTGEIVKSNYGLFTGLSPLIRVLLAPIYGLQIAYYCATGKDVNLQFLESN